MKPFLPGVAAWLRSNWWQVALVAVALMAYVTYRGSTRTMAEEARIARLEASARRSADSVQQQREYIAKRRDACYGIYVREREKWSNAEGPEYDFDNDVCRVRYKDNGPKKDCSQFVPDSTVGPYLAESMRSRYFDCETRSFTRAY
jgi:hypothetical protein